MKHKCTACGHEDEINPGKLLGAIRTPKREAAWKKHGERLKDAFAELRRVKAAFEKRHGAPAPGFSHMGDSIPQVLPAKPFGKLVDEDTRVMPKGSLTKDDLRALIAGKTVPCVPGDMAGGPHYSTPDLSNTPHAPFDLILEGEPHRVRQIGKKLMLVYLGNDGETPIRPLAEGELEKLWEKRIVK